MQIPECISNADKARREAECEPNPYKRNVLLEIEQLFQRLAEAEKMEPLNRRMVLPKEH